MSTPQATDLFLVQRGTTQYKATYAQLPTLQDADLVLVQRGTSQYKATGAELKAWLGGVQANLPSGHPYKSAPPTK
jgi:hypothetical protein